MRRGDAPAPLGFFAREFHHLGAADIRLQRAAVHEHAAPYDLARLADALETASAQPEVHGRLALTDRARIAADEMLGRHGARDLEDPHEFIGAVHRVGLAIAHVVQRGFRRVSQRLPNAIGDQRVQARALVHFVEVRQRVILIEHAPVAARAHRRPVHVVQQAFGQVGSRRQVLQPLLILYADSGAAKVVGDAQRRDVHLALFQGLRVGQLGLGIAAGGEVHALAIQPGAHLARFAVAGRQHFRVERRLAEALLEHAGGMQQLIRDDGVVHAHAAFVEDPQNGLVAPQFGCQAGAGLFRARRQLAGGKRAHVAGIVHHRLARQPAAQAREEELVGEIHAP